MGKLFVGDIPVTEGADGRESVSGDDKVVSGEMSIGSLARFGSP